MDVKTCREIRVKKLLKDYILLSESYVVKNRSRILSLLNIPDPLKTPETSGPHQVGASSSVTSPLLGNGSVSTCTAAIYNERRMAVTDF